MGRLATFFLLALLARSFAGTDAPLPEPIRPFQECLVEIQTDSNRYHGWFPDEIFTMDRRLYYMDQGISALGEDLKMLTARLLANPGAAIEHHMASNAAEGCRAFRAAFESRAHHFLALMLCLVALLATLTLRALLIIFRRPKPKSAPKNESPDSPQIISDAPSDGVGNGARSGRNR